MKSTRKTRRAARKLFQLCATGGELDEARVRMIAGRLAASPRRGAIQALMAFQRLVRLDRARHTARVESAAPLGDERARDDPDASSRERYGPTLETAFADRPRPDRRRAHHGGQRRIRRQHPGTAGRDPITAVR